MKTGRRIWLILLAAIVVLIAALALPDSRHALLRAAGWVLVVDDTVAHVNVIVIAVDDYGAGVLEAANLVHQGIAPRVALFSDPPDVADREFARRGVPYYDAAALSVKQLHALGISTVEVIERNVSGTEEEASVLPRWCAEKRYDSVLLVTSPDHSRRVRRALRRALAGHGIDLLVRYSRLSPFDPDGWWHTRTGIRTELVESEKLVLDVLRHPLS